MEVYGKSLIFIVFLLILLFIIETLITKINNKSNKEGFENIVETTINSMNPFQGDSSTIIQIKGLNFNNIGKIVLKNNIENSKNNFMAECIILDEDRDNENIKFIPPSISELGITILDIRNKIKTKNEGYKVSIYLIRKDKTGLKGLTPEDKNNVVLLPNVYFYYIDKIPYANNCSTQNKKPKIDDENLLATEEEVIDYKEGSDLEFVNKILPKRVKEIEKFKKELEKIIEKNSHYQNNDTDYLQIIQALDFIEKYKKNNNSYRYNLHKRINDRYNYNLF